MATAEKEFKWTDELTKLFITLRSNKTQNFSNGKKAHRTLYMEIGAEMGIALSPEQLRKKWNNLCRKYKDIKNPPTGTGKPAEWSFYNEMDEVLGETHSIVPPLIVSNSGTVSKPLSLCSSPSQSPMAKRSKVSMASVIQENLDKMSANDDKLVEQQERMLNAFERLIGILEKK